MVYEQSILSNVGSQIRIVTAPRGEAEQKRGM